jgi:hypothetical protein
MGIVSRKLRDAFLKPEWQFVEGNKMPSAWEDEPPACGGLCYLEDEVAQWCRENYTKPPTIWFLDLTDYDKWVQNWLIDFRSEADALLFKMRWSDYRR